jgi:hypothetical protein
MQFRPQFADQPIERHARFNRAGVHSATIR